MTTVGWSDSNGVGRLKVLATNSEETTLSGPIRVIVHDFEEGTFGQPVTELIPPLQRSIEYPAFMGLEEGLFSKTSVTPVYSNESATGSRSMFVPGYVFNVGDHPIEYEYVGRGSSRILGAEITFKYGSSPDPSQLPLGTVYLEIRELTLSADIDYLGDGYGLYLYETPGNTTHQQRSVTDPHQWFTAKILPTGQWSIAGSVDGVLISGTHAPPVPGPNNYYNSQVSVGSQPGASGGYRDVASLYVDSFVLWLDPPNGMGRLLIHDFEEGSPGDEFVASDPGPLGLREETIGPARYSDVAASGSRSLVLNPSSDMTQYAWEGDTSEVQFDPVRGAEVTFKFDSTNLAGASVIFDFVVSSHDYDTYESYVEFYMDGGRLWYVYSFDRGYTTGTDSVDFGPKPIDTSRWLTATLLPDGTHWLSYTDGGLIYSGQQRFPISHGGLLFYVRGWPVDTPSTPRVWIDNIVFWTPELSPWKYANPMSGENAGFGLLKIKVSNDPNAPDDGWVATRDGMSPL